MDTQDLIAQLSREAPSKPLAAPKQAALQLALILGAYGLIVQFCLGLRPDLVTQLIRPAFLVETLLLLTLSLAGLGAAMAASYPDALQKPWLLKLPYALFALLVLLVGMQLPMTPAPGMVMPLPGAHGMECALCIASVALVPSAILFGLLRHGASVRPLQAGSFAVLAASGIGCLTLRLAEANDALTHVAGWHYLPTLLFAALGAGVGKYVLRW